MMWLPYSRKCQSESVCPSFSYIFSLEEKSFKTLISKAFYDKVMLWLDIRDWMYFILMNIILNYNFSISSRFL